MMDFKDFYLLVVTNWKTPVVGGSFCVQALGFSFLMPYPDQKPCEFYTENLSEQKRFSIR